MSFLLDTNVVSEPRRRRPDTSVVAWLHEQNENELFMSALTLGEIASGAGARGRRDAVAGRSLSAWLSTIRTRYGDRILSVTGDIAETWSRLGA